MSEFTNPDDIRHSSPWGEQSQRLIEEVQGQIPNNVLAVGILNSHKPRPDELLLMSGCTADEVLRWCNWGFSRDTVYRAARRNGLAVASPQEQSEGPTLAPKSYVMMHVQPAALGQRRWWWLLMGRRDNGFSETEQQKAGLLLRQWQVMFDQIQQQGNGRVLLGHDDRVIHVDPWTAAGLLDHPDMLNPLSELLRPVVEQRWPGLPDEQTHDLAIELEGQPYWIRFHRGRAIDAAESQYWHLELYPLENTDLPIVGLVEDERIARAIAYLHDNFHESPSLSDIARFVHVSSFHFHRLFSKQVGVSPKHYLQGKQLQVAKWLLRSTRTPVGAIASKTGFASHGHFTSTFHRLVGVSPSTYREQH